jgi:hypothetical protein
MLTFDTTHALTGVLIAAEQAAASAGWGATPQLRVVLDTAAAGASPTRRLASSLLPVPADGWYAHPDGPLGVLTDLVAGSGSPTARAGLPHVDQPAEAAYVLAFAFGYETRVGHGDDAVKERRVDAVDLDGRLYRLTRRHGEAHPIVAVDDDPLPDGDPPTRAPLTLLINASHPRPTSMRHHQGAVTP